MTLGTMRKAVRIPLSLMIADQAASPCSGSRSSSRSCTRNTDFMHLRDGWVRGITARAQAKKTAEPGEFQDYQPQAGKAHPKRRAHHASKQASVPSAQTSPSQNHGITARAQAKKTAEPGEFQDESFGSSMNDFKAVFGNSPGSAVFFACARAVIPRTHPSRRCIKSVLRVGTMNDFKAVFGSGKGKSVPKGQTLVLMRDAHGALDALFQPGADKPVKWMGRSQGASPQSSSTRRQYSPGPPHSKHSCQPDNSTKVLMRDAHGALDALFQPGADKPVKWMGRVADERISRNSLEVIHRASKALILELARLRRLLRLRARSNTTEVCAEGTDACFDA
jgi:hypothetical protein